MRTCLTNYNQEKEKKLNNYISNNRSGDKKKKTQELK